MLEPLKLFPYEFGVYNRLKSVLNSPAQANDINKLVLEIKR